MAGTFLNNLGDLTDRTQDPSKPAVIDASKSTASEVVTHGELDALCDGIARTLANCGLARGARVAVLSANRLEYLAVYLGIMRAGMVAVPVNFRAPQELPLSSTGKIDRKSLIDQARAIVGQNALGRD